MKVALVIERMETSRGGRETSTAQIASGLARRGHEVTVLCQRGSWRCEAVNVRPLGSRGLLRSQRLRNFVLDVQREMTEQPYDVVHAMLPVPGADVYQPRGGTVPAQAAASLRRRSPAGRVGVAAAQRLNLRRRTMAALEREVAGDTNVLCLPVSQMVAEELALYYGRVQRVRVVYNAADVPDPQSDQRADWRQRLRFKMGIGSDDPVFLTVAKNFALKGVSETIRAFARWFHANHRRVNGRLIVVGRDLVEGYQRHAGLRDVGAQVVFIPPTDEVFQWYAAADVCILLSWYDPCSRVVLEATRWGIPSITTAYNGAAEVLEQGAGIVVSSPADIRAVVEAMDELADPKRRSARVEACWKLADRLGMDRHVEELLKAYAEAARRR